MNQFYAIYKKLCFAYIVHSMPLLFYYLKKKTIIIIQRINMSHQVRLKLWKDSNYSWENNSDKNWTNRQIVTYLSKNNSSSYMNQFTMDLLPEDPEILDSS